MPAIELSIVEMIEENLAMWATIAPHERAGRTTVVTSVVELLCLLNRSDIVAHHKELDAALKKLRGAQIVNDNLVQQALEHVTAERILRFT